MIRMVAVGDISLGDHYFNMGHGTATRIARDGMAAIFHEVRDELLSGDIAFANLETPLLKEGQAAAFCGSVAMAPGLKAAGFNILNIANNHILQHGAAGFHYTVEALKASSISPLGVRGGDEYRCEPVTRRINGRTVVVLGYSQVREVFSPSQSLYAQFEHGAVLSDLRKVSEWADVVIVSLHFGTEGIGLPSVDARSTARWLIEHGADVVLGHHPHVFQPVERYRDGVILYSLGDFVFDLFWRKSYLDSAIARLDFTESAAPAVTLTPVTFGKSSTLRKLSAVERDLFLETLRRRGEQIANVCDEEYAPGVAEMLSRHDRYDALLKSFYFLSALPAGSTRKKLRFLSRKLRSRLTGTP